ncbi:hypothetical protein GGI06_004140 [Coemansia sp. S85]|nr:hypothetical protein GGI06_004140 [Coemansia sp. S85]
MLELALRDIIERWPRVSRQHHRSARLRQEPGQGQNSQHNVGTRVIHKHQHPPVPARNDVIGECLGVIEPLRAVADAFASSSQVKRPRCQRALELGRAPVKHIPGQRVAQQRQHALAARGQPIGLRHALGKGHQSRCCFAPLDGGKHVAQADLPQALLAQPQDAAHSQRAIRQRLRPQSMQVPGIQRGERTDPPHIHPVLRGPCIQGPALHQPHKLVCAALQGRQPRRALTLIGSQIHGVRHIGQAELRQALQPLGLLIQHPQGRHPGGVTGGRLCDGKVLGKRTSTAPRGRCLAAEEGAGGTQEALVSEEERADHPL